MKPAASIFLSVGILVLGLMITTRVTPAQQATIDLERALGKWQSTEQFEGESRITVAFRRKDRSVQGWAVLLGQHRKGDNRATLGLSFTEVAWDGRRFAFSTILPDDEGTIGWELRVTSPTTAVLTALTEDGQPIEDELKWEMTK